MKSGMSTTNYTPKLDLAGMFSNNKASEILNDKTFMDFKQPIDVRSDFMSNFDKIAEDQFFFDRNKANQTVMIESNGAFQIRR